MALPLPDFSASRVLVVGDVMLDRYWYGATSRISPEAPVPVVRIGTDEVRAGGAGNVALNAAALGARASVIGLVGEDEAAHQLQRGLADRGVLCSLQVVHDAPTITKLRVISRHQQLIRLDFEGRFPAHHGSLVEAVVREQIADCDALVLSDYAKGTLDGVQDLIKLARAAGVPVVVDPKGEDFERYRGATVVKPNLAEFEAIVGPCPDDAAIVSRGEALRADLALDALLITRGEQGVTLIQQGRAAQHLPTRAREVFDVTGAGDTVSATLACGLAVGLGLHEATALANLAAGVVVAKLGTATVSLDELREAMAMHIPLPQGCVAAEAMAAVRERARAAGERVVLAFAPAGPVDGQTVRYLERARACGDRLLLVAPAPVDDRLTVLAALKYVDWLVPAPLEDHQALVRSLRPEVFVHPAGSSSGLDGEALAQVDEVRTVASA